MVSKEDKIRFQLESLPKGFLELRNSEDLITISISAGSGLYEDLSIGNEDLILECTMEWNTGTYKYELPIGDLIDLLSNKPFSEITHEDLQDYERELWKTKDGTLKLTSINSIEIGNTQEIVEVLKGTAYEIDTEDLEDAESIIEDKMNEFYSDGEIGDSEIRFYSLFELEFDDEEIGTYSVNWHYHENYFDFSKSAYNGGRFEECIGWSLKYLSFELDNSIEEYFNSVISSNISSEVPSKVKDVLRYLSDSYECLEKYNEALKHYKFYVKVKPDDDFGFAHIGACHKYLGDSQSAIEGYTKAIEINPRNIYAIIHCADQLVDIGEQDRALELLNKGIQDNPTQPSSTTSRYYLFQQAGEIYHKRKDWINMISSYEQAVSIDNKNAFAFLRLAYGYKNTKKYAESFEAFKKCIDLDDRCKDAYTFYFMGEAAKNIDNYEEAAVNFKLAIEFNDQEVNPYAFSGLGYSQLMINDFSGSLESYSKAISNKWTYQNLGKAYYGLNDYTNAASQFEKVIELDSSYKWAFHWYGDSLFQLKRFEEALSSYEKLVELDSSYPNYSNCTHISTNLALLYHYNQNFEKSNEYYVAGKEYDKGNLWKHYYAILSSKNIPTDTLFQDPLEVKDLEDSKLILNGDREVLELAFFNRGVLKHYYNQGENKGQYNHEISLESLSQVLDLNPNNSDALYHRARIISGEVVGKQEFTVEGLKLINVDSAIKDLRKCIEGNDHLPAYKLLISILKDEKSVKDIVDKGSDLFSKEWTWWSYVGSTCKKMKLFSEARDAYLKSIELNPEYSYDHNNLGNIYLSLNDPNNAIKFFQEAIRIDDWNELFRYGLSKAYLYDSNIDQAEIEIKATIKSYSGDKDYFLHYAKVLGEKYKTKYPNALEVFTNYVNETSPHEGRFDEVKSKIKLFLNNCDNYRANSHFLFEHWELFLDIDIETYLKHGSYNTMVRLSKNKSLTKEQLTVLMTHGDFTVLENIASNPIFTTEELVNIINENDETYSYSYKLLGVIDNPNCSESILNDLRDNKYSWVRKKVFSKVKDYKDEDLKDRYKLLGLIENGNLKNELKDSFKEKLKNTDRVTYSVNFELNNQSLEEYICSEKDFDSIIDELTQSILSEDEDSWYDHCSQNWYEYGESEYGLITSIIPVSIQGPNYEDSIDIAFGDRVSQSMNESRIKPGTFIFEASSSESGEYFFHPMELEFELRPEYFHLETSDRRELLSGLEYNNPMTDEDYYSSGKLVNSSTHGTDISLGFKTAKDLIWITHYEDIVDSMGVEDSQDLNESSIRKYFEGLL